jgi:hypothetical protein
MVPYLTHLEAIYVTSLTMSVSRKGVLDRAEIKVYAKIISVHLNTTFHSKYMMLPKHFGGGVLNLSIIHLHTRSESYESNKT